MFGHSLRHKARLGLTLAGESIHCKDSCIGGIAGHEAHRHALNGKVESPQKLTPRRRRLDALAAAHHFGVILESFGIDSLQEGDRFSTMFIQRERRA